MRVIETRKIDSLGRILLPISLRNKLDIYESSDVDICVKDGQVILRKSQPNCKICGQTDSLKQLPSKEVFVCAHCCQAICALV